MEYIQILGSIIVSSGLVILSFGKFWGKTQIEKSVKMEVISFQKRIENLYKKRLFEHEKKIELYMDLIDCVSSILDSIVEIDRKMKEFMKRPITKEEMEKFSSLLKLQIKKNNYNLRKAKMRASIFAPKKSNG